MLGRRHVLPMAAQFLAAYPRIDLRLSLADRQLNLVDEHIDVAVRIGHLEDSGIIGVKVGEVGRVDCAARAVRPRASSGAAGPFRDGDDCR